MSETSQDLDKQFENNVSGPDYFGFYSREIAELFSQREDVLGFLPESLDLAGKVTGVARENSLIKNMPSGYDLKQNYKTAGSASLFSDAIGSQLTDFGKEKLKASLHQSLFTFTEEVDAVLDAVLGICRVQSFLRYKESLLKLPDAANDGNEVHNPQKKQNEVASLLMDDDLRLLLDNKNAKVEEVVKKHSAQLFATIEHMEQKLENFLDLVLSNSRLMTLTEKQKLQKLIQNLPPRNLDRVVEIIRSGGPFTEEMHVDLEEENKVTLWRLYYYVEAVENARKLCKIL